MSISSDKIEISILKGKLYTMFIVVAQERETTQMFFGW